MDKQFLQKYSKYSFILLGIIIAALSLYILFPFLISIVASAIIVYIFYPLFKRLNKHTKRKGLSAFIMLILIVLIVIIPIFLVFNALFTEAVNFYQNVKNIDLTPLSNLISGFLGENINLNTYVEDITGPAVSFIVRSASDVFFSLPQKILALFLMIFIIYYFFKDGDKLASIFEKIFPIRRDHKLELLAELNNVIYAVIYGVLITAVVQGIFGTLGLIIFDVSSPILWGSIMVLTATIPLLGTWIIWLPASLFKIFSGEYFNGFGLLFYGILIVATIDNFIKPKLISERSKIHPVLIILGVFGGLKVFGIIGIMLGPIILGILSLVYNFYFKKLK